MKLYTTTTSERASKGQGGNKYIICQFSYRESDTDYHFAEVRLNIIDNNPTLWVDGKIVKQAKQLIDNDIDDQERINNEIADCLHNWDDDEDELAICKTCGVIRSTLKGKQKSPMSDKVDDREIDYDIEQEQKGKQKKDEDTHSDYIHYKQF